MFWREQKQCSIHHRQNSSSNPEIGGSTLFAAAPGFETHINRPKVCHSNNQSILPPPPAQQIFFYHMYSDSRWSCEQPRTRSFTQPQLKGGRGERAWERGWWISCRIGMTSLRCYGNSHLGEACLIRNFNRSLLTGNVRFSFGLITVVLCM